MKVSLITTVKNEAQYADALIRSILSQSRQPDEWIVVDGGSDDNTVEKFKAVPLCTVIEQPCNRARGRNLAIAKASGEIIAITDVGCLPGPNWLQDLVARVRRKERVIAAGQTICRVRCPFDAAQHALMDQFVNDGVNIRHPAASCRSLAFHRQAWQEYPFPEWLDTGEDSWLLIRWRENGWITDFSGAATMEWIPQQSFASFVRQYFRYIRGEGQAAIHSSRHLLRIGFYLGLLLLPFISGGKTTSAVLASCLIWLGYFLVTTMRLSAVVRNRPFSFAILAFLWMFPALPTMDAAKTAGFIVGSLERLILPKYRKNT